MKLPRDLSAQDLIQRLKKIGYEPTRQTGSHVRLTRRVKDGEHHVTIPMHDPLKIGTLSSILNGIAEACGMDKL
jgi:predicted RNA binding protein YcfA (HicA-like mRNA interferase family)